MLLVLFLPLFLKTCSCFSHQAEIQLKEKEQTEFQVFVNDVNSTFEFPNPLMHEQPYLLKYFASSHFKKDAAKKKLEQTLKWREKLRIEFNQVEPYKEFLDEYPIHISTRDRDGRPILFAPFGHFDHFKISTATAKKRSRYLDYVYSKFESASNLAIQEAIAGRNISRWIFLMDVYGFDSIHGACLQCAELYGDVALSLKRWPLMIDSIIFLNTPEIFRPGLESFKVKLEPEIRKTVVVIGNDPAKVKKLLLQLVDEKDFPEGLHIAKSKEEALLEQFPMAEEMSRAIGM